jgi:hypothetical protein
MSTISIGTSEHSKMNDSVCSMGPKVSCQDPYSNLHQKVDIGINVRQILIQHQFSINRKRAVSYSTSTSPLQCIIINKG